MDVKHWTLILFVGVAMAQSPETQTGKARFWRRVSLIGACAMSAWDGYETSRAKSAGWYEANPLLRAKDGSPDMVRVSLVKAATCGGMAIAQEKWLSGERWEKVWTGGNVGMGAAFGGVAMRTRRGVE